METDNPEEAIQLTPDPQLLAMDQSLEPQVLLDLSESYPAPMESDPDNPQEASQSTLDPQPLLAMEESLEPLALLDQPESYSQPDPLLDQLMLSQYDPLDSQPTIAQPQASPAAVDQLMLSQHEPLDSQVMVVQPQPGPSTARPRVNSKSRAWCFTLNNPTRTKEDTMSLFPNALSIIIGDEVGENGTKHLQGYIRFKNAVSFNCITTALPGAHVEAAKGDPASNFKYCSKGGKFVHRGTFNKSGGNHSEENRNIVKRLIDSRYDTVRFESTYVRNKNKFDEIVKEERCRMYREKQFTVYEKRSLRKWQVSLLETVFAQNERQITWFVQELGNCGKTWLSNYLSFVYGFIALDGIAAARDIAMLIGNEPRGFIFDVNRDDINHFCYSTLESVKNGRLITGKYAGFINEFKIVPVLVLANFLPDRTKLSQDRWDIHIYHGNEDDLDEEGTLRVKESFPHVNYWALPEGDD